MADPPSWWATGNPPVIDALADVNNLGPANVGQAKWMAMNALDALRVVLGTDAPEIQAIEAELYKTSPTAVEGVFFPERPATPSPEWNEAQNAPLQIGALKALAIPFYRQLSRISPSWVEAQLGLNGLSTQGSDYFVSLDGTVLPWNPHDDGNSQKNLAMAAVGQLKCVFSLRLDSLSSIIDSDGDGLTNNVEITLGTNPWDADSDQDGMTDAWEIAHDLDPLDESDASEDSDADGLINSDEFRYGTNPLDKDTDDDYVSDGIEVHGI